MTQGTSFFIPHPASTPNSKIAWTSLPTRIYKFKDNPTLPPVTHPGSIQSKLL